MAEIDGLRFLAIAAVFYFHVHEWFRQFGSGPGLVPNTSDNFSQFLRHGYWGVQLFFVLSGFILGYPFARHYLQGKKKPTLKAFFLRRVTRLEPPYIVAMVICLVLAAIRLPGARSVLARHFLAGLAYAHGLVFHTMNNVNGVAWSLEVEIQFYILVPFLAYMFGLKNPVARRTLLTALVAVGTFLRPVLIAKVPWIHLTLLAQFQYFLLGLLVADLYVTGDLKLSPKVWDALGIGGLALLCATGAMTSIDQPYIPLMAVPLMFLIMLGALWGDAFKRVLSIGWVSIIGGMCYSIYLLHHPIQDLVLRATGRISFSSSYPVNFAIQSTLTAVATIAVCSVFFLLVEKPCMDKDWPAKLMARLQGRPVEVMPATALVETEAKARL